MSKLGSQVALLSLPDEANDSDVELAAEKIGRAPGVVRSAGFVRVTPSDQPFAATFAGRGLVVAETSGDGRLDAPSTAGTGVSRGAFAVITVRPGHDGAPPDFATAAGILLVLLNNTDPARDDDFNRWYDDTHLADVTGAAGFRSGIRGRNVAGQPEPGSARYAALYCTGADDPLTEQMKVRAAAGTMELWPSIDQMHNAAYRRIGGT